MKIEKKQIDKHQTELTIRVSKPEAREWLNRAAAHLSEHKPIKGFRPGKAPFDVVKREFGEPMIIHEALEDIINGTLAQALEQENLQTYGKIAFDLLPALNSDEVAAYKATVTLMPQVRLGKWQNKKIKRQPVKISEEELAKALDEMAALTTAEEPVERAAAMGDKTIVDFEVFVDSKLIEGGQAADFGLILGEGRMIPGFEEKIVGGQAGDKIEFTLNFPENYQAAHLSGKPAEFKIKLKQVLGRTKPVIDEEFAKRVGVASVEEIKNRLRENIRLEKENSEEEKLEIEAMKHIVDTAEFDPLPQIMVDETVNDLTQDFEHTLAHQGMRMDAYLQMTKKTLDQIKKEFEPKALQRIKSSMALGQLAEDEKINITTEEINQELAIAQQRLASNPQALEDTRQPEYRRHIANTLINRKLIDLIKDKIIE